MMGVAAGGVIRFPFLRVEERSLSDLDSDLDDSLGLVRAITESTEVDPARLEADNWARRSELRSADSAARDGWRSANDSEGPKNKTHNII